MSHKKLFLWTTICLLVLIISISLSAKDVSVIQNNSNVDYSFLKESKGTNLQNSSAVFTGKIKVHIIEPDSRWQDDSRVNYDNAHLDYIVLSNLNIPDASVWDTTVIWDGALVGFGDVTSNNIGTAVAVFEDNNEICDADPPNGNWFFANYAVASAMAYPGINGKNETSPTFTHTVYIEEGSATW